MCNFGVVVAALVNMIDFFLLLVGMVSFFIAHSFTLQQLQLHQLLQPVA